VALKFKGQEVRIKLGPSFLLILTKAFVNTPSFKLVLINLGWANWKNPYY